jgi:hypothetical protein
MRLVYSLNTRNVFLSRYDVSKDSLLADIQVVSSMIRYARMNKAIHRSSNIIRHRRRQSNSMTARFFMNGLTQNGLLFLRNMKTTSGLTPCLKRS